MSTSFILSKNKAPKRQKGPKEEYTGPNNKKRTIQTYVGQVPTKSQRIRELEGKLRPSDYEQIGRVAFAEKLIRSEQGAQRYREQLEDPNSFASTVIKYANDHPDKSRKEVLQDVAKAGQYTKAKPRRKVSEMSEEEKNHRRASRRQRKDMILAKAAQLGKEIKIENM